MGDEGGSGAGPLAIAATASVAAALVHAAAVSVHAEHAGLTRLFAALAIAQAAAAVAGFLRGDRRSAMLLVAVNAAAALGWLVTRLVGIAWIAGLETAEPPQPADTIAAALALVAVVAAAAHARGRETIVPARSATVAAVLAGVLTVPALIDATAHRHADHEHTLADPELAAGTGSPAGDRPADHTTGDHTDDHTDDHTGDHTGGHTGTPDSPAAVTGDDRPVEPSTPTEPGDAGEIGTPGTTVDAPEAGHDHPAPPVTEGAPGDSGDAAGSAGASWPRPWDPTAPIDFSGVPGVSPEQQARAEQLVADTLRELPAFADVGTVGALGYRSIGDAATGVEHYINTDLIGDDRFLDPTAPESLVYAVDGERRTLVSAMFIVGATPIDDPRLTDFAGPLIQWHVHRNLCWAVDADGTPVVEGVTDEATGACPPGTVNAGGDSPMTHVWIAPHECGPFAALEGHGAGQTSVADGARTDVCGHDHTDP